MKPVCLNQIVLTVLSILVIVDGVAFLHKKKVFNCSTWFQSIKSSKLENNYTRFKSKQKLSLQHLYFEKYFQGNLSLVEIVKFCTISKPLQNVSLMST